MDSETGLYYLQSRYYDPQTCRFLNADTTDILEAKGDLYDKNLFAYCDNNPVALDPAKWRGRNLLGFALMTVRQYAAL